MNLSEKIKKIRIELHLKQDDIAIACNVTRGTVAKWVEEIQVGKT